MKKIFSTKNIAGMAVFSALSFVAYLLDFPIFPAVDFLKFDFSNVFVLLGGFMYGPVGGIIILVIKEAIHIPIGHTLAIGELANVLVGIAYIIIPTLVYTKKKGIKTVIVTMSVGCVFATAVAIITNKFLLLPFFCKMFDFKINFSDIVWYLLAFNTIKFVVVSTLTFLLYKKLSALFQKIKLQEK